MVKFKKFRIKNYRSIKDTGWCFFPENMMLLIGKNESGKTSILEALEAFSPEKKFEKGSKPVHSSGPPEVCVEFELTEEDKSLINKLKSTSNFKNVHFIGKRVVFCKSFSNTYSIPELINEKSDHKNDAIKDLFSSVYLDDLTILNKIETFFKKLLSIYSNTTGVKNLSDRFQEIKKNENFKIEYKRLLSDFFSSLKSESVYKIASLSKDKISKKDDLFSEIDKLIDSLHDLNHLRNSLLRFTSEVIPDFVFLKDKEMFLKFTSVVPYNTVNNSKLLKSIQAVSGKKLSDFTSLSREKKMALRDEINKIINKTYSAFWNQDRTQLFFDFENNAFFFYIKEDENYFDVNIRSIGKKWHLSFFFNVFPYMKESRDVVVLIDEPGLYLHMNAQKDVFSFLKSFSEKRYLIFSTHSPPLINVEDLSTIKVVEKRSNEGTIISPVHKYSSKDVGPLLPIQKAIGASINFDTVFFEKNVFLVEGISDHFFLNAFKILLGFENIYFIPTGGTNMINMAKIMIGFNVFPKIIIDKDDSTILKGLKSLSIEEENIIRIPVSGAIEDMFSEKDRKQYAIGLFDKRSNKFVYSKDFFNKVKNKKIALGDLSKETVENFEALFDKIKQHLNQ